MEAIVYDEFGGPEVLRQEETDKPEPGAGEVRVKVVVAGVNPLDHKRRYGWVEEFYPSVFPMIPGLEFAGVVDAVGEGATHVAVGDEVLGWTRTGAYAEYAIAGDIVHKPAGLSFEQAAALPVAGETAQRVLDLLRVKAGETLLVHGAAGAVGSVAVQLAVAAGVTVIGTASLPNHDHLRSLGAVAVEYGDALAERVRAASPHGVDAVFDAAGQGVLPLSIELAGGSAERVVTIADPQAAAHGIVFTGGGTDPAAIRAGLAEHARLAAEGRLRVRLGEVFALADAAKAQELSESGHARGKLLIRP
ncbi:NADP-dependent oxidoreductase [Streptomyces sp. A1136]|uniref:NADP-dependent oxidoreductase n=1 Tax=Streptomyces sp. A1136 TaxID=2563102 RepID=UPI00109E61A0|nr:NADP-dependent oxidoreductase [Streptomyces sp. A1136]THA50363.1 NADP-dependent oxidoreductase [Streptomyces sp. A1136]